jgi:endoribonuclease LACTB2
MLRPTVISPGIEAFPVRTPTLPPATHTNSYALGSRDVLLVEPATPYRDEQTAWLEWVRGLDSRGRRPVAVFLTHHHVDHVGGAALLSGELGLPLWAHAATAERLPELRIDRLLADGDSIVLEGPEPQRWTALHTPGHAPGHLCLLEETSQAVVVGDMVASEGTILIEPVDGDMAVYLAQLERLESLNASVALPAHGTPIEQPSRLFAHYVKHRLMREAKVLAALTNQGEAGATPHELVPHAYADTPRAAWPLARLSSEAHLIKLAADGRVVREGNRYRALAG